jgi:hypothetical protein
MSARSFGLIMGMVLFVIGTIVGISRFDVTSACEKAMCSSYFDGATPPAKQFDAPPDQDRQFGINGRRMPYGGAQSLVSLCDAQRPQRGTWTWLLIGGGLVLYAACLLIRNQQGTQRNERSRTKRDALAGSPVGGPRGISTD